MYPIVPEDVVIGWQLLHSFRHPFEYISQDLKLQSLSKFKPVVSEGKTESSLEYPTKALLVQDENITDDELQLLKSFVSQHPQTTILLWGGEPVFSRTSRLCQLLKTLHSLEYLCISNGYFDENWPKFIYQFKRLKLVYFTPNGLYYIENVWTINTPKTVFIMDFVKIERIFGTLE
jgi:hypothetical protein